MQLDTGSSDTWVPSVKCDACVRAPDACQASGSFDDSVSSSFSEVATDAFAIQYEYSNASVQGDYISETLLVGSTAVHNLTLGLADTASRPLGISKITSDF